MHRALHRVRAVAGPLPACTVTPARTFLFGKRPPQAEPSSNLQQLPTDTDVRGLKDLKSEAQVEVERAAQRARNEDLRRRLQPMIKKAHDAVARAKAHDQEQEAKAKADAATKAATEAISQGKPLFGKGSEGEEGGGVLSKVRDAWRARRDFVQYSATRSAEQAMELSLSRTAVAATTSSFTSPPARLMPIRLSPPMVSLWAPEFQTLRTDLAGTFARAHMNDAASGSSASVAAGAGDNASGALKRATVDTSARPATVAAVLAAAGAAPGDSAATAASAGSASAAGSVGDAERQLIVDMDLRALPLDGPETTVRERVQVPGRATLVLISSSERGFGPALGMQRIFFEHFAKIAPAPEAVDGAAADSAAEAGAEAAAPAPAVADKTSGSKGAGKKGGRQGAASTPKRARNVTFATLNLSLAHGHIVKTLLSGSIRANLTRQVPPHLRPFILPFFESATDEPLGRLRTALDCRNAMATYYLLLDEAGRVRWRHASDRMPSAEEAGTMLQRAEELVEEMRFGE